MVATTDPYMTEDADDAASLDVLEQSLQAQIKDGNLKFIFCFKRLDGPNDAKRALGPYMLLYEIATSESILSFV